MAESSKERTYSDEEIQKRLKHDLPHWYLENGWIRRKYRTNSWKGTLMVINTVGHLAEAAWHHPDITASYAWVEVRLQNHAAKGITDKDFELAHKIEETVHWQPGKDSALEGTPEDDQRFAYIKYDKPACPRRRSRDARYRDDVDGHLPILRPRLRRSRSCWRRR